MESFSSKVRPKAAKKPRKASAPTPRRGPGPRAPQYAAHVTNLLVAKAENGKTLQDFLVARLGVSRRTAKAVIDGRSVWVNRRCVWIAHHTLKTGDGVEVPNAVVSAAKRQSPNPHPQVSETGAAAAPRHIRILVESKDFVVADKPAGILTNETPGSIEALLRVQLNEPTLQAVHRLDRDTTGCVLLAKNYAAYLAAVEVFKTRKVRKEYRAIVVGKFPFPHQLVTTPLDGQSAVSHVLREVAGADASFLRVRIETGRTNQIRRHLAGIRFPIVGDRTFGLKRARDARLMAVPRQMLHAATLELPNPTEKGAVLRAHSPLPADFRATLKLFGMGLK